MTPERLDEIRQLQLLSKLSAPDAAVTKALEELIGVAERHLEHVGKLAGIAGQMQQHAFQAGMAQQQGLQGMVPPYPGQLQAIGQMQQDLSQMRNKPMFRRPLPPLVEPPKPWWKLW
jgi:hypothetical protein